jgi:hypothetical protein
MKGDVWGNTEPRQVYDSITDMPTSQARVRHVFFLTADRRTDLVGRPLLYVHPTISMTHTLYIYSHIWSKSSLVVFDVLSINTQCNF